MSENGTVQVLVELPGVEKKDVKLNCTEKTLIISVDTEKRRYFKEVELPTEIDPKVSKASYKNGVLQVTLTKAKKETPKGESIKID
jgi:HSP20 family protein